MFSRKPESQNFSLLDWGRNKLNSPEPEDDGDVAEEKRYPERIQTAYDSAQETVAHFEKILNKLVRKAARKDLLWTTTEHSHDFYDADHEENTITDDPDYELAYRDSSEELVDEEAASTQYSYYKSIIFNLPWVGMPAGASILSVSILPLKSDGDVKRAHIRVEGLGHIESETEFVVDSTSDAWLDDVGVVLRQMTDYYRARINEGRDWARKEQWEAIKNFSLSTYLRNLLADLLDNE